MQQKGKGDCRREAAGGRRIVLGARPRTIYGETPLESHSIIRPFFFGSLGVCHTDPRCMFRELRRTRVWAFPKVGGIVSWRFRGPWGPFVILPSQSLGCGRQDYILCLTAGRQTPSSLSLLCESVLSPILGDYFCPLPSSTFRHMSAYGRTASQLPFSSQSD